MTEGAPSSSPNAASAGPAGLPPASDSAAAPASAPAASPMRPRRLRWLWRLALVALVMLVLIAIVVQIVLWSSIPQSLVVGQIEKQLGLRLSVHSLTTGWLGYTQLNDVTISLPLAEQAFLTVPVMKVKNTSLFGLILGQSVEVQAIELDRPHLSVWQDASGRWNLQEVIILLARAGGAETGQQSAAASSAPVLPNVRLVDGLITIIDNKRRRAQIEPLSVDGYRDTALSWKYEVKIPPRVSIVGRVAPGGDWGHELSIHLADLGAWVKPWLADAPDVSIDATWRGALTLDGVGGRLELHPAMMLLNTGAAQARGSISVGVSGAVVTLRPDALSLDAGQKVLPPIMLAAGTLSFNGSTGEIKLDDMLINALGGPARISADYSLNARAGRLTVGWEKLAISSTVTHSGSVSVELRQPYPNKIIASGSLTSTGQTSAGPWVVHSAFAADGSSPADFDWSVTAGQVQAQVTNERVILDGLKIVGSVRDRAITVSSITLPNPDQLSGQARYSFKDHQAWSANLRGQHWPLHPITGTELGFELAVSGGVESMPKPGGTSTRTEIVRLENLVFKSPDVRLSANGKYVFGDPKPLQADVTLTNAPPTQAPAAIAQSAPAKIINGAINGHFSLAGTVRPLNVEVRGDLDGREIDIRGHHLGEIDLLLSDQSHVDANGVFLYTQQLALLGGQWGVDGLYIFGKNGLDVRVGVKDLSLADAALLADVRGITGTLDGRMSLFVPGLAPSLGTLEVHPALLTLRNVTAPGGMHVEEVDATVDMQHGMLRLEPIRFRDGAGRGDARAAVSIDDLRRIDLGATFSAWPIDAIGAPVHVDAWLGLPNAAILLPDASSHDPASRQFRVLAPRIDVRGSVQLKGEMLGSLEAHAGIEGRVFDLRGAHMKLLGGRIDGQAHASLDHLTGATAEFTWEKLDVQKLGTIFPILREVHGELTGDLRLAPTTVPRPREPLALVMKTQVANGRFRTMPIVDARLAAYIGPNEIAPEAGWRLVMADSKVDPSFIHVDGGSIELWGRAGFHGRSTSSQMQISLHGLDLDRAVHAVEPTAASMPGRIDGAIMLLHVPPPAAPPPTLAENRMFPGPPGLPVFPVPAPAPGDSPLKPLIDPVYAEGKLQLSHTNLLRFGPFAFLYNASKLFNDAKAPDGSGGLEFHLERGRLSIERMRYFNRGTEIRAIASIDKIYNAPNSPFAATAYLTARPLRDVQLPVFSDFDSVLTAIQSSLPLTGVRASGTLHSYRLVQAGLADMGDEMKRFFVTDATTGGGSSE